MIIIQLGALNNFLRLIDLVLTITHPMDENDPTPTYIKLEQYSEYIKRVNAQNASQSLQEGS